jgi:hypothetical protein
VIPEIDMTGMTMPILTYAFRNDTEAGHDFSYVQAESMGVYVNLNHGYDGKYPWTNLGDYGFLLLPYDDPLRARLRFVSDGAWSDEDGDDTDGGAFMCDVIRVFDYADGTAAFYDDVESGGLCAPGSPTIAGDWWHVIDRACPARSDPHSWWCGDDADTGCIPPNLNNALFSPIVEFDDADACTVSFAMHFAVPTVDNDYVSLHGNLNGGEFVQLWSFWGDFGTCDGWARVCRRGFELGWWTDHVYSAQFAWVMHTTGNGCGPGEAGDAGVMLDDLVFDHVYCWGPVENASWSRIKALYRQAEAYRPPRP